MIAWAHKQDGEPKIKKRRLTYFYNEEMINLVLLFVGIIMTNYEIFWVLMD